MNKIIQAVVHDRQFIVPVSDDLPYGTKVEVRITTQKEKTNMDESDWDDSPEGIDVWIKAVRELEPIFSNEVEQTAFDKALQDQKDWEKSQFFEQAEKLSTNVNKTLGA